MKILTLVFLILPSLSLACSQRKTPNLENLSIYSGIYSGTVVKVDIIPLKEWHIGGYSDKHNITINVTKAYKGTMQNVITFYGLYDCALPIPKKGEKGLFFINTKGTTRPIYHADGVKYKNALKVLDTK